jgi:hypothetical protein
MLVYMAEELGQNYRNGGDAKSVYRQTWQPGKRYPVGDFLKRILADAGHSDPWSTMQRLSIYFDGIGTSTLPEYFQMRLEAYAVQLLSGKLKRENDIVVSRLNDLIAQDAFRREFRFLNETQVMYTQLVFHMADRLATSLRESLDQIDDLVGPGEERIDPRSFTYALIPAIPSSEQWHFVLSAMPVSGGSGTPRCYVSGKLSEAAALRGSQDFSGKDMYAMGLLTRPARQPAKANPSLAMREHFQEFMRGPSGADDL